MKELASILASLCLLVCSSSCTTPPEGGPFLDAPAPLTDGGDAVERDAPRPDMSLDGALEQGPGEGGPSDSRVDRRNDSDATDAFPGPANSFCDAPEVWQLENLPGPQSLRADTSAAVNDMAGVSCGATKVNGEALDFHGPQRYYLVTFPTTGIWELSLDTSPWTGVLYVAPWPEGAQCDAEDVDALNAACAHLWTHDRLTLGVESDAMRYLVVVDSLASTQRGVFTLTATKRSTALNAFCSQPRALSLSDGKVAATGNTRFAADELGGVRCGQDATTFRGGQRYYSIELTPGTTYKISLESAFDLALYAFPSATPCDATAIGAACADLVSDKEASGAEAMLYTATEGRQALTIVVDSYSPAASGAYTLRVEEFIPASNVSCDNALSLSAPVDVDGDTLGAASDPAGVSCGLGLGDFDGNQLYYSVELAADSTYYVTVKGLTFDAALYAFPSSTGCDASAMDAACSEETAGRPLAVDTNFGARAFVQETLFISTPATTQRWTVVVDARDPESTGTFNLIVDRYQAPSNSVCAESAPLEISGEDGALELDGDTASPGVVDDALSIDCEGKLPDPLAGPQLYYRLSLAAGGRYVVDLAPRGWDGALYAFPAATSCTDAAAINLACGASAKLSSDTLGPNIHERVVIEPTESEEWIVAVDSFSSTSTFGYASGPFTLSVTWSDHITR